MCLRNVPFPFESLQIIMLQGPAAGRVHPDIGSATCPRATGPGSAHDLIWMHRWHTYMNINF